MSEDTGITYEELEAVNIRLAQQRQSLQEQVKALRGEGDAAMTTTKPGLAAMALALAGAKKECPCTEELRCGACALVLHVNENALNYGHATDCLCKGTGEVYVLPDEVRVACKRNHYDHGDISHEEDGCRGWNPLDPEKLGRWMAALAKVFRTVLVQWDTLAKQWQGVVQTADFDLISGWADEPGPAFFQAAMLASGLGTDNSN